MVYNPFLMFSNSVARCKCLRLRCLLSDRHSNLFSKVTAFSVDLKDFYLHIPVAKYNCFMFCMT